MSSQSLPPSPAMSRAPSDSTTDDYFSKTPTSSTASAQKPYTDALYAEPESYDNQSQSPATTPTIPVKSARMDGPGLNSTVGFLLITSNLNTYWCTFPTHSSRGVSPSPFNRCDLKYPLSTCPDQLIKGLVNKKRKTTHQHRRQPSVTSE